MVSYLPVVFSFVCLIGVLLQTCMADSLGEPNALELNSENAYDDLMEEKRGGGRFFAQSGLKRAGGRAFRMDKRGGGRGFQFNDGFMPTDKRAGGRAFYSYGSIYPNFPLVYKKADFAPYYYQQQFKRGGARAFVSDRFVNDALEEEKRAGGRHFKYPIFLDDSTEKRLAQ